MPQYTAPTATCEDKELEKLQVQGQELKQDNARLKQRVEKLENQMMTANSNNAPNPGKLSEASYTTATATHDYVPRLDRLPFPTLDGSTDFPSFVRAVTNTVVRYQKRGHYPDYTLSRKLDDHLSSINRISSSYQQKLAELVDKEGESVETSLRALKECNLSMSGKGPEEIFGEMAFGANETAMDYLQRLTSASKDLIISGPDTEKKRFKRVRQKLTETAGLTAEEQQRIRCQTDINDLAMTWQDISDFNTGQQTAQPNQNPPTQPAQRQRPAQQQQGPQAAAMYTNNSNTYCHQMVMMMNHMMMMMMNQMWQRLMPVRMMNW